MAFSQSGSSAGRETGKQANNRARYLPIHLFFMLHPHWHSWNILPENRQHLQKTRFWLHAQVQAFASHRMLKAHGGCGQHQPPLTKTFGKVAVMAPSPVVGIPNNGMVDMLHMPAQLVLAAGFRIQLYQAVAAGGIAFDFHGNFSGCQATVSGAGIAHRLRLTFTPSVLRLFSQWVINIALLWCPTPNHGQIGFAYLASHHRLPQSARSFWIT